VLQGLGVGSKAFLGALAKGTFGSRTSEMSLAIWARDGVHDIGLKELHRGTHKTWHS
jgi:hypothetical protein